MDYETFRQTRLSSMAHQEQVARKEREEQKKKMERYMQIRQKVEHEQRAISHDRLFSGLFDRAVELLPDGLHDLT